MICLAKDETKAVQQKIKFVSVQTLSDRIFIMHSSQLELLYGHNYKTFPVNNKWKISGALAGLTDGSKRIKITVLLSSFDRHANYRFIEKHKQLIRHTGDSLFLIMETTVRFLNHELISYPEVIQVDLNSNRPKEELATPGFDLSANRISAVHKFFPAIDGNGIHISVKEQSYDSTDIDLRGRHRYSTTAAMTFTNHANFIATIIAGGGNSTSNSKGVAWAASVSSSSFDPVLPDPQAHYQQEGISIQNHSYGTVVENFYGLNAVAFDQNSNALPSLLHVFSSGNVGTSSGTGPYANLPQFANLTGNFKQSKNTISVGAVDSFGNVAALSSRGPAYDGRIKPELVAFEKNGTSEAAAVVSGVASLLQHQYKLLHNQLPASAFIKAVLISTATDVNKPGPDHASGFGNVDAIKAIQLIRNNQFFNSAVSSQQVQNFSINVPTTTSKLKLALCWNDPAATAQAGRSLINDLDLNIVSPNGTSWNPWVLSSFPHTDSLNRLAVRGRDSINNVELITIDNPVPGAYTINVSGKVVLSGSQQFSVAWSFDTAGVFQWQTPGKQYFDAGTGNVIRWNTNLTGNGLIEYCYTGSSIWQAITQADLAKGYSYWQVPDTMAKVRLRMVTGTQVFVSDTILLAKILRPSIGFICGDSLQVYWNSIGEINRYRIFKAGEKYMEPLLDCTDTSIILRASDFPGRYLAVAAVLSNGEAGPKSNAIDYNAQGTGCYVKSFTAGLFGNSSAMLELFIGSNYQVTSISFEKLTSGVFVEIYRTAATGNFDYSFLEDSLKKGLQKFRAMITLANGNVIYSDEVYVYIPGERKYLLLPVPVGKERILKLFTLIPEGEIFQLIDMSGRIVFSTLITTAEQTLSLHKLPSGQYIYRIINQNKQVSNGKLILL